MNFSALHLYLTTFLMRKTKFYTYFWFLVIAFAPPLEEMEWTVKPILTEKI